MNRINLCLPRLILKISLIFTLILTPTLSKAVPDAVGWISNCYQKIYFEENRNIKMLYFGGNPSLTYGSTTGTALPYFSVRQYEASGFENITVPGFTPHTHHDAAGHEVIIYENNGQIISLPENVVGAPVFIDFYSYGATFYSELSITIDFVSVEESFNFKSHNQSCFTYNNFQIKKAVTNLEGLCNTPYYTLTLPREKAQEMGLDHYSEEIHFGNDASVEASTSIDIPINDDECSKPNYACQTSSPCGCINFNMEIMLIPCNIDDPNCPITTVSKPIRICCRCGVPDNEYPDFPSMGKNTASTALTGENSEVTIYPNPNQTGKLQVSTSGNPVKSIKIYAVDGKLVKNITVKEVLNQVSVDISNLQPGIYQVKVLDNTNAVSNKKLIVQ